MARKKAPRKIRGGVSKKSKQPIKTTDATAFQDDYKNLVSRSAAKRLRGKKSVKESKRDRRARMEGLKREMEDRQVMKASARSLDDFGLEGLGRKVEMIKGYDPITRRQDNDDGDLAAENKFGALMDNSDSEGEDMATTKAAVKRRNVFDFAQPRAHKLDFLLNPIDPDPDPDL